jgi:hypothetical protein
VRDPIEDAIDSFNNRGLQRFKQMVMAFLQSLVRPVATVTEKLYRRQMGERYFTLWNAFVGVVLILAACIPISIYTTGQVDWHRWTAGEWASTTWGLAWLIFFFIESCSHFHDVRQRYVQGVVLHTYSYGTDIKHAARFAPTTVPLLCVIVGVAAAAFPTLCNNHDYGLVGIGGLLALSGLISGQMRMYEAARFRKMVLDTMDAHIAQKHLANAVAQRLKPAQAEGLNAPMPAYVSDKYRERFAQAISPARVRPTAPLAPAVPTPQPEPVAVG